MMSFNLVLLIFMIFIAGLIDSIAGGGGLISLAAYTTFGLPPHIALGTNKFSSSFGTTIAAARYIKAGEVEGRTALVAAVFSLMGSILGAHAALLVSDYFLSIVMLVLTPALAVFTLVNKSFGEEKPVEIRRMVVISILMGIVIGAYDGFYGPGTGMFLTLGFNVLVGLKIEKACGNTKLVNLASNIGALATFILNGQIDYAVAIPCALASIGGNFVGAGLAIHKGARIVRPIFLVVLAILFVRLITDFIH